jgi:hypothetical protein
MGLRFRKSLRIAPGVRINLSQRGLSTTVGPRGATVSVSSQGTRGNVGLPGTGLSYSQRLTGGGGSDGSSSANGQNNGCALVGIIGFLVLLVAMCSKDDNPGSTGASSAGSSATPSLPAETRYVSARALNCRAEPSASASVVAGLTQNDPAEVVDTSGTWSRVQRTSGDCWVASSFLAAAPVLAAPGLMASESSTSRSYGTSSSGPVSRGKSSSSTSRQSKRRSSDYHLDGSCPCSGSKVCIGPRGGRYCITSGGNKRYGV